MCVCVCECACVCVCAQRSSITPSALSCHLPLSLSLALVAPVVVAGLACIDSVPLERLVVSIACPLQSFHVSCIPIKCMALPLDAWHGHCMPNACFACQLQTQCMHGVSIVFPMCSSHSVCMPIECNQESSLATVCPMDLIAHVGARSGIRPMAHHCF